MLTTILPQIMIACGVAAAAVYLTTAKRTTQITREDANILWKLHKQTTNCNSNKLQLQTTKHDHLIGFQCQCGYQYTQKRPLLSRSPTDSPIATSRMNEPKLSKRTTTFQLDKRQL